MNALTIEQRRAHTATADTMMQSNTALIAVVASDIAKRPEVWAEAIRAAVVDIGTKDIKQHREVMHAAVEGRIGDTNLLRLVVSGALLEAAKVAP